MKTITFKSQSLTPTAKKLLQNTYLIGEVKIKPSDLIKTFGKPHNEEFNLISSDKKVAFSLYNENKKTPSLFNIGGKTTKQHEKYFQYLLNQLITNKITLKYHL
ncbi:MAG: hypothetical protein COU06_02570 [Candidatus Harrisonbacteria bacterium CG10_big_fil_rev_8_21_14_0_10_38_8]|uniref:Uncharacterized protein n=1 Tax=Candidatus Harrisonbacteria bacterium CG10_big_fil_rev_8_21_14_0_10_38_8 TaxID=1974582 RepID=A0A2M6WJI4_9BACT|nr:MAG: hypothetical protein COU06_02570 [Candidatus Harrisonbacteria bacterium CG10_big_fil_rev_8_21_14_0_10_38_8]